MFFLSVALEYRGLGIPVLVFIVYVLLKLFKWLKVMETHVHIRNLLVALIGISIFYLIILVTDPTFIHNTFYRGDAPRNNFFFDIAEWTITIYLALEIINKVKIFQKNKYLIIVGVIFVWLVIIGFVINQFMPVSGPLMPVQKFDNVDIWHSYYIDTEPSFGYTDYTVEVPSFWKRVEHSSNFQDTETFMDSYENTIYKLVIHQEKNYNPKTGKAYATLQELSGFPYDLPTVIVDRSLAVKVLPRAGSETIYKVLLFSEDMKMIFSIELETPVDGSKLRQGEEIFNRILASFSTRQ